MAFTRSMEYFPFLEEKNKTRQTSLKDVNTFPPVLVPGAKWETRHGFSHPQVQSHETCITQSNVFFVRTFFILPIIRPVLSAEPLFRVYAAAPHSSTHLLLKFICWRSPAAHHSYKNNFLTRGAICFLIITRGSFYWVDHQVSPPP